jgi:trimeric autotransporter adhesin
MFSMRSSRLLSLSVFASAMLFTPAAMPQTAAPAVRIVNPIDESQLVTLKGTVHPLANARNDRGAAPDSLQLGRMHLVLTRSASQETALRQLINDMHTPGAPSYHKWLTPDQFGKQFGPSDQDITTVETWLTGHGFNVTKVNPGKLTLEFTGNAAQVRSAFHTQIHQYEVNGETHYANSNDPQIPAALAPVVGGFVALNNFRVKNNAKVLGKATYDPRTDKATPEWTWGTSAGVNFVLAPQDYDVQYDLGPLYTAGTNGGGQTIAIVNDSNVNMDLVNQFRTLFSLPANPPQVIIDGNDPGVDGINNPDGPNYDSVEAYLDVEWSGAVAPNATIDLVIGGDTALEPGLYLAAERAVYGNIAPIVSLSFGACEATIGTTNTYLNALWEQAAAQGITVTVSTGDAGSAGCDNDNSQYYAVDGQAVNGFASTPFDVAVGGTDFFYSLYNQGQSALGTQLATYWTTSPTQLPAVSIKGVIPEQPWNDSQFGLDAYNELSVSNQTATSISAGGGGASAIYTTKPAWQKGTGVPADSKRDLPDVSLFAANGFNYSFYPICASDGDCQNPTGSNIVQITGVGGTSAAAPSFAGIMALVNQLYGRQGQADFVLYPLATQFPTAFHDVKFGTNSVPCEFSPTLSPNCIAPSGGPVITDPNLGPATEGQIGTGTTPEYNATLGYDLASGLGTIDANQLVTNWGNVKFATTQTTLTPSSTSFAHGTAITVSGSVTTASGTPSGAVALITGSTQQGEQGQGLPGLVANSVSPGTFALSSGNYSGSVSTLPGGTYNIWGQYSGDGTNGMSSSTPVSITVNPEASSLAFNIYSLGGTYTATTPPGTSVDYGTQLELSAQVKPTSGATTYTAPTGTVTFKDNSSVLNTALINVEGDAEYSAPFAIGTHSVTASYSGDLSYNAPAAATAIPFTVVKDTPLIELTTSLFDSNNNAENGAGQPTVITVIIENGIQNSASSANAIYPVPITAPTGSVTVSGLPAGNGTFTLNPGVDASDGAVWGVANVTVPAGSASGNYNVTISYIGDGNYNAIPATSGTITIDNGSSTGLQSSTTAATLTGSISPTTSITVTGTVTGQSGHPAPTGSVYIYASGFYVTSTGFSSSSGVTSNFSVTLNSSILIQGANLITVQYLGDTVYNPSAVTLNGGAPISNPLSDFTLIPDSTIVPVTAGGSGSTTVNLASMNGFSGAVGLTCTAAAGITCSLSTSSDTLTSGGSGSAAVTISAASGTANGNYNVLITGTSGSFIHTLGITAAVSGAVSTTPSFALSNSGNVSILGGATTGDTSTITVTPSGGFTGTVTLLCNVTTVPTGATSPINCNPPAPVTISGTTAATSTLTIGSTSTTTAGAYVVTVTGESQGITQTTTVNVTITTPVVGTFTLASNPTALTLSPGATTGNTSTISVTGAGGFASTVALTCSVSGPSGATDPATCSLSPASVTISGASAETSTLTVNTTAATTALNRTKKLFWPSAGGATLALVLFFGIPKRRRNWLAMLGLLVLFVSLGAMGCNSSNANTSGGGGGSTGTTAGTYTVTVTGTAGTTMETTAVTVTVN